MIRKDVLPEKDLLEKAAALTRFEYSPLGNKLKKQTSAAEKQYQSFNNVFRHDEKEKPVKIKKEGLLKYKWKILLRQNIIDWFCFIID